MSELHVAVLRRLSLVVVFLVVALMTQVGRAAAGGGWGDVITPLSVVDLTGVDRQGWPLRGGVPLPRGRVAAVDRLRLLDAQGQPLPLQAQALAHWPDGSVKWVLLHSTLDLPARGQRELRLVLQDEGQASEAAPAPLAVASADHIVVDTGPLRLTFPRGGEASLWWLDRDLDGNGAFSAAERIAGSADMALRLQRQPPGPPEAENWLRDASSDPGLLFTALNDPERTVRIEENGPRHAIVRLDGWHADASGRRVFPYTLRVHFDRGSGRVGFQHTFTATEDVDHHFVRSMSVRMPGVTQPTEALVGQPAGSERIALTSPDAAASTYSIGTPRLYHMVSFRESHAVQAWIGRRSSEGVWQDTQVGEAPPGWLVTRGQGGAAAVGFRDFWRMHPKELRASGDGSVEVYLWPDRGGKCLDLRRRSGELRPEYVENGADPHQGRGIAVTHHWWVEYVEPGRASDTSWLAERAVALAAAAAQPLRPIAPPSYVAGTGAFGEFLPAGNPDYRRIDAALSFSVRYLRQLREAFELDGMIDWGDVPIAGVGAADHARAQHPEGLPYRGYTGWLNNDMGLAHGLFLHYLRTGDPRTLLDAEAMTRHVMDVDTIHYYPESPELLGHGRRHDQQHWGNGPRGYCFAPYATIDYFLLTGDRRAYDVAKLMADHPAGYGRYSTIRFWEISEDSSYREAAERLLAQDLAGGTEAWPFVYGQNFRSNSYDGIGYTFYDSIQPTPELTAAAVRALALKTEAWLTPWMDPGHATHLLAALAHRAQPTAQNTEVLKVMIWDTCQSKVPLDPTAFDLPGDAPFEQYVALNSQTLQIGRTDMLALYYLIGLPRLLARLEAAGVDEAQCLEYQWQWIDPESFTETFEPARIRSLKGNHPDRAHEFDYYTDHHSPSYRPDTRLPEELVAEWEAAVQRHRLYEDGRLIGPHPWPRSLMGRDGLIGWTRRLSGAAVFTTPDNSDARTNGRTYQLVYTSEKDEHWQDVPSFREVLDPARIMPFGSTPGVWVYNTRQVSPLRVSVYPVRPADEQRWLASRGRHRFLIDGQPQGPMQEEDGWGPFWKGRTQGWGRHQNLLMFMLPEGVDPRTDGRTYELQYTCEADAPAQVGNAAGPASVDRK